MRRSDLTNGWVTKKLNYRGALIHFRTTGYSPLAKKIREFLKESREKF